MSETSATVASLAHAPRRVHNVHGAIDVDANRLWRRGSSPLAPAGVGHNALPRHGSGHGRACTVCCPGGWCPLHAHMHTPPQALRKAAHPSHGLVVTNAARHGHQLVHAVPPRQLPGGDRPDGVRAVRRRRVRTSLLASRHEDDCPVCPVGAYCPAGAAVAAPCNPGTVAPSAGMKTCAPCRVGSYPARSWSTRARRAARAALPAPAARAHPRHTAACSPRCFSAQRPRRSTRPPPPAPRRACCSR